MGKNGHALKLVQDEVTLYKDRSESWKGDHQAAMRCLDLEHLLALGIFVFEQINMLDETDRSHVFQGELPHDPDMDQAIEDLYRKWCIPSDFALQEIADLEKEGFQVEKAEAFRRCCQEARGILTPDQDFFSGDRFVGLRDEAVDEFHNGDTAELKDLSDYNNFVGSR